MKLRSLVLLCLTFSFQAYSQVEKAIEVGQWVRIGACPKSASTFTFIDEYARVQPLDTSHIDRYTGEGLLDAFFKEKNIDAHRMPCLHANRKYQIAALHVFEDEEKGVKTEKRVMLLYSGYPLTLFWVQLDEAIEAGEGIVE